MSERYRAPEGYLQDIVTQRLGAEWSCVTDCGPTVTITHVDGRQFSARARDLGLVAYVDEEFGVAELMVFGHVLAMAKAGRLPPLRGGLEQFRGCLWTGRKHGKLHKTVVVGIILSEEPLPDSYEGMRKGQQCGLIGALSRTVEGKMQPGYAVLGDAGGVLCSLDKMED